MKKLLLSLLFCISVTFNVNGAQQTINLGSAPNGAGGDNARQAFTKTNENFTELYNDYTPESRTITIAGTANEISLSAGAQSLAANRTWTIGLPAAITLTGKTVQAGTFESGTFTNGEYTGMVASDVELGNALSLFDDAAPTTGAAGFTAFDTNAWAASRGAIQVHDGTANTYVIAALASDTPSNGQVPKWNTGGTITWENESGGTPTFDVLGDAAADGSIAIGAHEIDFTSTIDASGESVFTITNTDADAANDNSLFDLRHNDGADANVFYLRMIGDNDGTPTNDFLFSQAGLTATLPITASRFIPSGSTIPTNGLYLPTTNTLGWGINSGEEMRLTATALSPGADGGNSLGTTALGWQNIFANTGFVLNIENGNWVATHTSAVLTIGTGDLRVTTAGTNTASVITIDGTQTLANKTLTSPTVNDGAFDLDGGTLEIPNAAAPTVSVFGQIAGDNNLWAASRGTAIFFDGTAATAFVNPLVSDTPTNGQVPTWNTGGTITWETPASGSSLTATLVGYGSGANALTGEAAFNYDASTNTLVVDNLTTSGTATVGTVSATTINASAGAVRLPVAAGSATLAASGAISVNTTDNQVGIHNGTKEVAIPLVYSKEFTFDPKSVCDGAVDRLFLFKVGAWAPKGITIRAWSVSFEADPTTEVDLDLKRATAFIGVGSAAVMDVLDTTTGASSEATASNINGGAVVANGQCIYLEFGTAYSETGHQIIVTIDYELEED
jgi:hypothetical protein